MALRAITLLLDVVRPIAYVEIPILRVSVKVPLACYYLHVQAFRIAKDCTDSSAVLTCI